MGQFTELGLNKKDEEPTDEAIESMSLKKFFGLLTVKQWGKLFSLQVTIISMAFAVGCFADSLSARVQDSEPRPNSPTNTSSEATNDDEGVQKRGGTGGSNNSNVRRRTQDKDVAAKKREYNTLNNRITNLNDAISKEPTNVNLQVERSQAEKNLASFLDENVNASKDESGIPVLSLVQGETPAQSKIKFRGDETELAVPQKVKDATSKVRWYRGQAKSAIETIARIAIKR